MKRHWTIDELIDQWTLSPDERALVENSKGDHNRLGFALLLKYFQIEGRFPRGKHDMPGAAVAHVAKQLSLPPDVYLQYDWKGRSIKSHRAEIRAFLGVREGTVADAEAIVKWLCDEVLPHDHHGEHLREAVYARYQTLKIEPPTPSRLDRIIASALRTYEQHFCAAIHAKLAPDTCARLDALLVVGAGEAGADAPAPRMRVQRAGVRPSTS